MTTPDDTPKTDSAALAVGSDALLCNMSKQPMQPIGVDSNGYPRFKSNKIVEYLLENGGIDLNHLARVDFPQEDMEQFAQLIGYSLNGFSELGYVREETYRTAEAMSDHGMTEDEAKIAALEEMLEGVRKGLRDAATHVFQIHPGDLHA